jgi:Flp pilus assembly protein TadD
MVLDKLAESRAARDSRGRGDDDEDDDGSMKQLLMGMLPAMLSRGGGGGGTPQIPDQMMDQMIDQAFRSPDVIQKVAMRNPQGIAGAFMQAIKNNPALEKAVLDAVEKASGDDDED